MVVGPTLGLSALFATSGCPRGCERGPPAEDEARKYSGLALDSFVNLAQRAQSEGVRLNAILKIIDWGHGKPSQLN
jgi:hypothetical protein